ncbi:MAG: family 43 glycosylhydrolase [Clostridia bacterium]|nr:family 43 glycosylhydrolase [Clostridia bacterium]
MKRIVSLVVLCFLSAFLAFFVCAEDFVEISSAEDLLCLMNKTSNSSGVDFSNWDADASYRLTADITVPTSLTAGDATLKPASIGYATVSSGKTTYTPFRGTFDGNGHTVTFNDRVYKNQTAGMFGCIAGATVTDLTVVFPSTNNYTGMQYTGGIVGWALNSNTISGCTFKGRVTSTYASGGGVGGIVGRITVPSDTETVIANCKNEAEVAGYWNVGGIVGVMDGTTSTNVGKITVSGCLNTGKVWTTGTQNVGGIAGYLRAYTSGWYISDCMNTGNITAATNCAGGILGKGSDVNNAYTIKNCYSTGTVSGVAYVRTIAGAMAPSALAENCFYTYSDEYYTSESLGYDGVYASEDVDVGVLGEKWIVYEKTPELKYFHVHNYISYEDLGDTHAAFCYCDYYEVTAHEDKDSNNICDLCGASTVCTHAAAWYKDENSGKYCYGCVICNTRIAEQDEAKVYVNLAEGNDENSGLDVQQTVLTVGEAIRRLANVDKGTVSISGRYNLSHDVTLPAWSGLITFTSTTFDGTYPTGGFAAVKDGAGSKLTLGGDAKFDKIAFFDIGDATIGYKHYGFKIVGGWNNVEFGYIRVYDEPKVEFIAGDFEPSSNNTENQTVNIVMAGPSIPSSRNGKDYTTVFSRVILGDYVGDDKYTLSGKTVNFTAKKGKDHNVGIDALYMMSANEVRNTAANVNLVGGYVNVNLNDATYVDRLYSTMPALYDATTWGSYLDRIVLNLNGNSSFGYDTKYSGTLILNVKETDVNVSFGDSRTTSIPGSFAFASTLKDGVQVVSGASASVTYGTHSFEKDAYRTVSEKLAITVVEELTDECVLDDGTVTLEPTKGKDGIRTYKCTVCERTRDEVIEWVCQTHTVVVKPDGNVGCIYCDEEVEAPTADVMIMAENAVCGRNTVTVDVRVKAATPFAATRFSINAPSGFTLVSAKSALENAENTSGFATVTQDAFTLPYNISVINMSAADGVIDDVVITLTFSVDSNVASDNYAISVTHTETVNSNLEDVNAASIGAMAVYKKIVYGDATGDEKLTLLDVLRTLKYSVGQSVGINLLGADCNNDGAITIIDTLLTLNELLNVLPLTELESGKHDTSTYFTSPYKQITQAGDPFVMYDDASGRYYMYCTGDYFKCFSSETFNSWESHGSAYAVTENSFGTKNYWAPSVYSVNGEYIMVYSAANDAGRHSIGIAKASSPAGPFTDIYDHPLFAPDYSVIDASLLFDGDKVYLYYSKDCSENIVDGKNTSQIFGIELKSDLSETIGEPKLLTTPDTEWELKSGDTLWNEGPCVFKENGIYYLLYSANYHASANYALGYATSTSPLGEYTKAGENPILQGDGVTTAGTGHCSVVRTPYGELYIAYHSQTNAKEPNGNRMPCIDKLIVTDDGKLFVNGPSSAIQPLPSGSKKLYQKYNGFNVTSTYEDVLGNVNNAFDQKVAVSGVDANDLYCFDVNGIGHIQIKYDSPIELQSIWIYGIKASDGVYAIVNGNYKTKVKISCATTAMTPTVIAFDSLPDNVKVSDIKLCFIVSDDTVAVSEIITVERISE